VQRKMEGKLLDKFVPQAQLCATDLSAAKVQILSPTCCASRTQAYNMSRVLSLSEFRLRRSMHSHPSS